MIFDNLNFIVEAALGVLAGGVILAATVLVSGGVDYLEEHITAFHKGPVYDAAKWGTDVAGSLSALLTFVFFQFIAVRKLWRQIKEKR